MDERAVFDSVLMQAIAERTVSAREIEAEGGMPVADLEDVWPPDVAVLAGRVYGRLLARIAQTELQLFRVYVLPRLRAEGSDPEETLRAARDAFESLMPLADPMITGVQLASGWQHLAGSDETGCGPCLSCAASRSSRSSSWSIGS